MFRIAQEGRIGGNRQLSDFWNDALELTGAKDVIDTVKKTVDEYVPGASDYVDKAVQAGKDAAENAAEDVLKTVLPGSGSAAHTNTQVNTPASNTQTTRTQTQTTQAPVNVQTQQQPQTAIVRTTNAGTTAMPASNPMIGAKIAPLITGAIVATLGGLIFKKPSFVIGGLLLGTTAHYAYRVDRQVPAAEYTQVPAAEYIPFY